MFQFSGFAHLSVYYVFYIVGCPIRISADQFVCANTRSFSQLITSFFASESLGILHTPLFCLLCCYLSDFNQIHNIFYKIQLLVCVFLLLMYYIHQLCVFFSYLNMSMNCILRFSLKFVENIGVEPMTSCVQGRRSSQLS